MSDTTTIIARGDHLHFVRRGSWEYVTRPGISGIVIVLPVTDDGEVILVEQYRPPVNARVIELCAGLAGDVAGQEDESLEDAARRELVEECGYHAENLEWLMEGPPAQGVCDEFLTFFKATGLTRVGDGGGDASEDIVVHCVPIETIRQWLDERRLGGTFIDPKIYAALYFLQ